MRRSRYRILWLLAPWLVGSAVPAVHAQSPAKKYALVVGLNEYRSPTAGIPSLTYAEDDVRDLTTALTARGYKVTDVSRHNATRSNIVAELARHAELAMGADDTFLLYFAGHGVRRHKNTYWLTYYATLNDLDVEGIRLSHLIDYLHDIPAGRKILLLDHCYSGDVVAAFDDSNGGRSPGTAATLRKAAPADPEFFQALGGGMAVLAASRGEAYELSDLGHGVFTSVLLRALNSEEADVNKDSRLSLGELSDFVRKIVPTLGQPPQTPLERLDGTDLTGWILADLPVDTAGVQAKADALIAIITTWAQRELLDSATADRCVDALLDWKANAKKEGNLAPDTSRILPTIRSLVDRPGPEAARATQLKVRLAQVQP